jgi:LysM repeat protein
MDNKDSNMKPQQTGGLKLMTVFIAVLALHVVVIGGVTVYHLMSGGTTDTDVTLTDKSHKGLKDADNTALVDATLNDKNIPSSTSTPPEITTIPATATPETSAPAPAPAPVADQTPAASAPVPAPAVTPAPAPVPAPAPIVATTKPVVPAKTAVVEKKADLGVNTPSGPIASAPSLAPPPEPAPTWETSPAPTAPVAAGPVHMPPTVASTPVHDHTAASHEHGQTYVVKITDSYKKIAMAHHVTVAQLKEANHIKGDTLHTGQKLIIPGNHADHTAIASVVNTSLDAEPAKPVYTNAISSTVTTTPATMTSHHHYYTVVKGDTLAKIAHKFKTTRAAIIAANDISNPAKLSVGKKLKIPSTETRSARIAPPAATPVAAPVAAPVATPSSEVEHQPEMDNATQGQMANYTP